MLHMIKISVYCYCYCYWGLKVHGFDKPPKSSCGHYKDQHCIDPNYHGLLILRDTHTFPVSQNLGRFFI